MAPRKSKSAGLPQKSLFTYTQGWVARQEQTTLDPMEAHPQPEAYQQSDAQQYDQIIWHQHEDATQAFQNLAQEFRPSKTRQLLPAPTNNPPSQKLPHFSYEAASLHGLYVPLPSYLPPHQPPYSTDFMATYPYPFPLRPERTLPPLPPLPPSFEIPGPLPEELRHSPFPDQVLPPSGTIWPPPPPGKGIEALQPDREFERLSNGWIDWEVGRRLDGGLDIGGAEWVGEGWERGVGEGGLERG